MWNDSLRKPGPQFTLLVHFLIKDGCGIGIIDRTYAYALAEY